MSTARYEAVILAAGLGSRMGQLTEHTPKALLPIGDPDASDGGSSFLHRQAALLHAAGVSPIVIVVGAHSDAVKRAASGWGLPLCFVHNTSPDISRSGSLHSFQYAMYGGADVVDGSRETLLLDADIIYEGSALDTLLDAPAVTSLLYRPGGLQDDEQVCVYGARDAPRFLGKALRPALVGGAPCLGEATGIVKFAPGDHALVRQTVDWLVGDPRAASGSTARRGYGPARALTEHEELSQRFMHYGKMRTVALGEDQYFMEADDSADYERARALYPEILTRDAAGQARG